MKTLTAKQVKRLEPGTYVHRVNEKTGKRSGLWVIKSGRKKVLRGILNVHEIKEEKNEAAV